MVVDKNRDNAERNGHQTDPAITRIHEVPAIKTLSVDIRVFMLLVILTMVVSFMAGVTSVPPLSMTMKNVLSLNNESGSMYEPTSHQQEQDEHRPAGQHLLVDMKGVDSSFLNSEERLVEAMVQTVDESGLTMLSYHCHSLIPSGISCVGVLLESHISFHTWPSEQVITLDLFTCGSNPLLPVVATIERLFGVLQADGFSKKIKTQWSHELRGFRDEEDARKNPLADSSDLSLWVLSPLEMHTKVQIFSGNTNFQRVDIWDIVEVTDRPSAKDVLKYNMSVGDPRLLSPDYASPDRLLFLDGTIQSVSSAERIYHEALVHPTMFVHPGPKHVVILGGGEGATLREVLKHETVETVLMLEIDEELVKICREFLPDFSNCSDLIGRADNCFDDERATIHYGDGRAWFINQFYIGAIFVPDHLYDVIIVDALDPEDATIISDMLYSDTNFLDSMVRSLSDDGAIVIQIGTAATIDDPQPEYGIYKNRENLFRALENNDQVEAIFVYEEPHCGYLEPHAFLVACRTDQCRSRWYARADQVDFEIYSRITRTKSKERALQFFDGTTQRSYQWPKKGWETVYCRRNPSPWECSYRSLGQDAQLFDFDLNDESKSSFRVETVGGSDSKVSHVYATEVIPKGSFVFPEHLASSLQVTSRNLQGLHNNVNVGVGGRVAVIEDLLEFFDEFGHISVASPGSEQHYIEVGGSVLVRRTEDPTMANVQPWLPLDQPRPKYSPVFERHRVSFDVFMVASRDIAEGEEVIMFNEMW